MTGPIILCTSMASGIHTFSNRLIKGFLSKVRQVIQIRSDSLYIGTAIVEVTNILDREIEATYTGHVDAEGKALGWGTAKGKYDRSYTGTFKDNVEHGVGKS